MMKHLTLVFLLSGFSSLTLMEVVENVNQWKSKCGEFFIPNPRNQNDIITPTVFLNKGDEYKMICQFWNSNYRFATLYDTVRRIPVYSAYTFSQQGNTTRTNNWKIEPQLENITEQIMMKKFPKNKTTKNITHQAVYSDYTNSSYTRGHVFPRFYAADQDQADSTFTLTNVAPQKEHSNTEWERQVERPMLDEIRTKCVTKRKRLFTWSDNNLNLNSKAFTTKQKLKEKEQCKEHEDEEENKTCNDIACILEQNHKVYIVTGVVPGNNWISITRNIEIENGINIPSHFWSAFCCRDINGNLISGAYIAEQDNFTSKQMTVMELNQNLTNLYNINFHVFGELHL